MARIQAVEMPLALRKAALCSVASVLPPGLSLRDAPLKMVCISTVADAQNVTIHVDDSGHGISSEALPRLFQATRSQKEGGLGFGLSISRTIVEAHGAGI